MTPISSANLLFSCLTEDHHCPSCRVSCSRNCWEMSSRTWNFPGEFRGRRWARKCSTEILPWMDGEPFSLPHIIFLLSCWLHTPNYCLWWIACFAMSHTCEENTVNTVHLQTPALTPAAAMLNEAILCRRFHYCESLLLSLLYWLQLSLYRKVRVLQRANNGAA